jgi:L-lactate dehydrogenase (cytochrome)
MEKYLNINELRIKAKKKVPKMFYDYCESGSWDQKTLKVNSTDLDSLQFKPKVVRNLANRSTAVNIFGEDYNLPLGFSPCGLTGMQYADGEILAALAAEKFNVPFTLSTMSIASLEDIADHVSRSFWFQLYVMKDRSLTKDLVTRAKSVGVKVLVLTVDLQVLGIRHNDVRNGLSTPPKITFRNVFDMILKPKWTYNIIRSKRKNFGNLEKYITNVSNLSSLSSWINEQFDESLSWDDIKQFRDMWDGKLIIKGIIDEDDAEQSALIGADGIVVSNHGGRQLDSCISSISALPKIKAKIEKHNIDIFFDGGIRSGKDILKAKCLGAKMAMMGRPYLYGLAAGGQKGVERCLEIFSEELDRTMALCGYRDINEASESILVKPKHWN